MINVLKLPDSCHEVIFNPIYKDEYASPEFYQILREAEIIEPKPQIQEQSFSYAKILELKNKLNQIIDNELLNKY
ncbi:MAG: hypothetical protein ACOCWM_05275 [Cyclobacteriaceae bacterium]